MILIFLLVLINTLKYLINSTFLTQVYSNITDTNVTQKIFSYHLRNSCPKCLSILLLFSIYNLLIESSHKIFLSILFIKSPQNTFSANLFIDCS